MYACAFHMCKLPVAQSDVTLVISLRLFFIARMVRYLEFSNQKYIFITKLHKYVNTNA